MTNVNGRRVLVTGAGGFIGSHLVEHLLRGGARVRAMVRYASHGGAGFLDDIAPELRGNLEIVRGDITDARFVRESFREAEIAWHLAALIGIPYSYAAPGSYVSVNTVGTLNALEAAREMGTEKIVVTSTSEVYGSARTVPMSESHPLQAQSPYSASKIAADKLAESYARSFDLPVVIARPFNTFGPRQSARAVIPAIIAQITGGAREIRLGALQPTRDFNDVRNTAEGMAACASAPKDFHGEVFNLGSGREISIGNVAALIQREMATSLPVVTEEARLRPESSEVDRLLCDATRAREVLGWHPRYTLEEGLAATIKWMREHPAHMRGTEYQT